MPDNELDMMMPDPIVVNTPIRKAPSSPVPPPLLLKAATVAVQTPEPDPLDLQNVEEPPTSPPAKSVFDNLMKKLQSPAEPETTTNTDEIDSEDDEKADAEKASAEIAPSSSRISVEEAKVDEAKPSAEEPIDTKELAGAMKVTEPSIDASDDDSSSGNFFGSLMKKIQDASSPSAEPDSAVSEADALQPAESERSKRVLPDVEEKPAAKATASGESDAAEDDALDDSSMEAAPSAGVVESSKIDERNDSTVTDRIRALRRRVKEYQEEKFGSEIEKTEQ